ncbi:hypothetical protein GQ600_25580 [Phytophthora cactorum]|nr:hypothetical protein GQ600_25580 [Phytophthora cactorum]
MQHNTCNASTDVAIGVRGPTLHFHRHSYHSLYSFWNSLQHTTGYSPLSLGLLHGFRTFRDRRAPPDLYAAGCHPSSTPCQPQNLRRDANVGTYSRQSHAATYALSKVIDTVIKFSRYLQRYHEMNRVVRIFKFASMKSNNKNSWTSRQTLPNLEFAANVEKISGQAAASVNAARLLANLEDVHGTSDSLMMRSMLHWSRRSSRVRWTQ